MTADHDLLHARARARARLGDVLMQLRIRRNPPPCRWCDQPPPFEPHRRRLEYELVCWEKCPGCGATVWSSRRDAIRRNARDAARYRRYQDKREHAGATLRAVI